MNTRILFAALALVAATASGCARASKSAPDVYQEHYDHAASAMPAAEVSAPASSNPTSPGPTDAPVASGQFAMIPGAPAWTPEGSVDEPAIAHGHDDPARDTIDQILIFTGTLSLAVEHGEAATGVDQAIDFAAAAGGYIAKRTDHDVVLRIPSGRFRVVMRQIGGLGEITKRRVETLDVSEEFFDLEVRLRNLEATRERMQALLADAKDLPQILTVEKELERITAEIDTLRGRLRFLSSQAAFSTLTVRFSERAAVQVAEVDPDPPKVTTPRRVENRIDWLDRVGVQQLLTLE